MMTNEQLVVLLMGIHDELIDVRDRVENEKSVEPINDFLRNLSERIKLLKEDTME